MIPLRFLDRAKETTTTTGSGTITLAGPVDGFVAISGIGTGNYTYYGIEQGTNFEVGIGRYLLDGSDPKLERHEVFSSSNSNNSKINLAGVSTVFITAPADKAVIADSGNLVSVTGLQVDSDGITFKNLGHALNFTDGTKLSSTEPLKWRATDGSTGEWINSGEYVQWTGAGGTTVSYNIANKRFTIESPTGFGYDYWVASDGSNSGKVPGSGTVHFVGAGTTDVTLTSGLGGAATVTINDTGVYYAGTGLYLDDRTFHASGATTSNSGIVRLHNAIGPQENLAITPAAVSGAIYNNWVASDGDTTADIFTKDTVQLKGESGIQATLTSGDPSIFTVAYTGEAYSWTAVDQVGESGTIESNDAVTFRGVDVDGAESPVGVRALFNSGTNTFTFSASGNNFEEWYVTPDHQKPGSRIAIQNKDYVEVTGSEGIAITVEAIGNSSGALITVDASGTKVSLTGAGCVTVTESGTISGGNQIYTISGDCGDWDKYDYWTVAGTETGTHTGTASSNVYTTNTVTFVGLSGIIAYADGLTVNISAEHISGVLSGALDDIYTLETGVDYIAGATGDLQDRLSLVEEQADNNTNNITGNDSDISDLEAQFGTSNAKLEGTIFEGSGQIPNIGIAVAPSTEEAYRLKLGGGFWLGDWAGVGTANIRIGENSLYIDSGSIKLPLDGQPAAAETAGSGYLINKDGVLWFNGSGVNGAGGGGGGTTYTAGTGLTLVGTEFNAQMASASVTGIVLLQDSASDGTTNKAITPNAVYDIKTTLENTILSTGSINASDILEVSGVATTNATNITTNTTNITATGGINAADILGLSGLIVINSATITATGVVNAADILIVSGVGATNTTNIATNATAITATGGINAADILGLSGLVTTNATTITATGAINAADILIVSGLAGGGGISWDGSTAQGVATFKDANEATVESNLTFNGNTLTVATSSSSAIPAVIKSASNQSANFFEMQNSAGAKKLAVDPSGRILMGHDQAMIAPLTINVDSSKLVWVTGGGSTSNATVWFAAGNGDNNNSLSLYLTAGTAGNSYINLGDTDDNNIGRIRYKHADDKLFINTNNSSAVDWDSDQKRYDYAASYGNTESGNIGTATKYLDLNESNVQYLKLTGNPTLKLEHVHAGQKFVLRMQQDGTGGRSGIWWGGIRWAGGIQQPTQGEGANKASLYGFLCTSSGHYDGFIIGTGIV